jgi:hypothetical protein
MPYPGGIMPLTSREHQQAWFSLIGSQQDMAEEFIVL